MKKPKKQQLDYEEDYLKANHGHFLNPEYYEARSELALKDFFKGIDLNVKLLDYGAGMGANVCKFKNVICYDISKAEINFCKSKGMEATTNLNEIQDESMDVVFCCSVLEHVKDPYKEIKNIYKKLKPNGLLILSVPYREVCNGKYELNNLFNAHLYAWDYFHLANLLQVADFKVKSYKVRNRVAYGRLLFTRRWGLEFYDFFTRNLVYFNRFKRFFKGFACTPDLVVYASKGRNKNVETSS